MTKILPLFILTISLYPTNGYASTKKTCKDAIARSQPYYHKLSLYRPPFSQKKSLPYKFSRLQGKHCSSKNRRKTMKIVRHTLRRHQNKIGFLLPLSGQYRSLSQSFIQGLKKSVQEYNLPPDLFVVRSTTTQGGVLQPLSQLVFDDDVSMIIGGLLPNEAETLVRWSDGLERPTLILNQSSKYVENKIYAYQFYPSPEFLAHSLLRQAQTRNYQNIAILKPNHTNADSIVKKFQDLARNMNIQITEVVPYTSGQYDSMNQAAATVFHTHTAGRPDEYRLALKNGEKEAKKAGLPFDPEKIILPPKPEAQAIFIPDDFRMVRHFIKLFRYHGVEEFPLIGHHEWRSEGLVDPWDSFLKHSFFADFIPKYTDLPIQVSTHSPWFLDPNQVIGTDFKMLGFHLGHLVSQAFKKDALRTILVQRLIRAPALFSTHQESYFSPEHTTVWPSWILNLHEHGLSLTKPGERDTLKHSLHSNKPGDRG